MKKRTKFSKFKQLDKKQTKKVKGGNIVVEDVVMLQDSQSSAGSNSIVVEDVILM